MSYGNNEHKTFLQVLQEGKDVYKQTYDVVIVEVYQPKTFQKRNGGTFTSQTLLVDDGTAPMPLRVNPIMTYQVGQGFHLEGCYIKQQNGYWRAAVAQPPKGSMTLLSQPNIRPSGLNFKDLLAQLGGASAQTQQQQYQSYSAPAPQRQQYQQNSAPSSNQPSNFELKRMKMVEIRELPDLSYKSFEELYTIKKECKTGSEAYWAVNDKISLMRIAREETQMKLTESLIAQLKALAEMLQPVAQALIAQQQNQIQQQIPFQEPDKTQIINFPPPQAQQQSDIPPPEDLEKMGLPPEAFDPNLDF